VTDPQAWLAERLADAPPSLRAQIEDALSSPLTPHSSLLADDLRSAAEALLTTAKSGPPTRETALALLAADALVTLACEWVAETEPERLGELQ
jgi:hypothetical protein